MSEDAPAYGPAKTCRHCGAPLGLKALPDLKWAVRFHARIVAVCELKTRAEKLAAEFGGTIEEIETARD